VEKTASPTWLMSEDSRKAKNGQSENKKQELSSMFSFRSFYISCLSTDITQSPFLTFFFTFPDFPFTFSDWRNMFEENDKKYIKKKEREQHLPGYYL
jgi:hypothetical protein